MENKANSIQDSLNRLESLYERQSHIISKVKSFIQFTQEPLPTEVVRDQGLELVVQSTESEGGYFHLFDEREQVIDLAAWSESVKKICDAEATIHYPIEAAGIWADSARFRKTVVHNDYPGIPEEKKGGLPEGHFPLYRHMSVPVFDHGKLSCIIGVGNKKSDYTKIDQEIAEIITSIVWIVLQQHRAREVLKKYSFEDSLTGIANRRRFDEVMESEWKRMRRHRQAIAVIMIDIDFFKKYNDFYGHVKGDLCLTKVARALQAAFRRAGELVCRYGGEEFVVIIPDTSEEQSVASAEKACAAVQSLKIPHPDSPVSEFVSISAGVACRIPDEHGFETILEQADKSLYKAKESGRNKVATV